MVVFVIFLSPEFKDIPLINHSKIGINYQRERYFLMPLKKNPYPSKIFIGGFGGILCIWC